MLDDTGFFGSLADALAVESTRAPENLVPPAFQWLFDQARFLVAYGGRAAGKSWAIARVLLMLAHRSQLRILCCREIQASIRASSYQLLRDQIGALGLVNEFDVQVDAIIHKRTGSRFFFEGLHHNASRIRSYEGVDIVWCEEAQNISELSWETLLPTIRKPRSRIYVSFNPMEPTDPVYQRFVTNPPPAAVVRKVSYKDNPYFSAEAEAERAWLERTDPEAHAHVWLGEPRTVSDAQVLRGKYCIEDFEVSPFGGFDGPYQGADWGFATDPTALVRCWVKGRNLYVEYEAYGHGIDIDATPRLFDTIPGANSFVTRADNARPETISYMRRNGYPKLTAVEKWKGSVEDGIAHLRSYDRIIIHPRCVHAIEEARLYSYRIDRLSGDVLPDVADRNNHIMDALRYALERLIKPKPTNTYSHTSIPLFNKRL